MRSRIIVATLVLVGAFSVGVLASNASKHWAIVNFVDPVQVTDQFVMGPVIVVHDDVKMARGEPCTTFYRFDPKKGLSKQHRSRGLPRLFSLPRRQPQDPRRQDDRPGLRGLSQDRIIRARQLLRDQ